MDITNEVYISPYSCYINLTSKCNLRCKHCFGSYSKELKNELTLKEWKNVIDDLIKNKVFYIVISGGEATQSPFFKGFIKYLAKKGMYFILTTNGVFSKNIRKFILKYRDYLISLKFSLDGPDRDSHGFLRLDSNGRFNPKIFDIALENIFFFKKHKIPITIATVLHEKNIKNIEKFEKLIRKINPTNWFISPIIPIGRGKKNNLLLKAYDYFDNNFWKNIKKEGEKKGINVNLIDMPINMEKEGLSAYNCAAAINLCEIHSDGTVSPCTLSRIIIPKEIMKFENIKEKSLKEIWEGKIFNKFRDNMNKGCEGCKMLEKCNKCVAQSFKYFKNGESPTPFCIKNGKALGLKKYEHYKEILNSEFNFNLK